MSSETRDPIIGEPWGEDPSGERVFLGDRVARITAESVEVERLYGRPAGMIVGERRIIRLRRGRDGLESPDRAELTEEQFLALPPTDQYLEYRVAAGWMAQAREWEKAVERLDRELQHERDAGRVLLKANDELIARGRAFGWELPTAQQTHRPPSIGQGDSEAPSPIGDSAQLRHLGIRGHHVDDEADDHKDERDECGHDEPG